MANFSSILEALATGSRGVAGGYAKTTDLRVAKRIRDEEEERRAREREARLRDQIALALAQLGRGKDPRFAELAQAVSSETERTEGRATLEQILADVRGGITGGGRIGEAAQKAYKRGDLKTIRALQAASAESAGGKQLMETGRDRRSAAILRNLQRDETLATIELRKAQAVDVMRPPPPTADVSSRQFQTDDGLIWREVRNSRTGDIRTEPVLVNGEQARGTLPTGPVKKTFSPKERDKMVQDELKDIRQKRWEEINAEYGGSKYESLMKMREDQNKKHEKSDLKEARRRVQERIDTADSFYGEGLFLPRGPVLSPGASTMGTELEMEMNEQGYERVVD